MRPWVDCPNRESWRVYAPEWRFFKTLAFRLHVDERKRMFSNTMMGRGPGGGGGGAGGGGGGRCLITSSRTTILRFPSHETTLIATTSHKRPPPVSDHFSNNRFVCFKHCFKNSLVNDHYVNFLNDRDHFLGQKFDIFFYFLFPVSDHRAWSRMIVTKPLLECHKTSFLNSADQVSWHIKAVDLQKRCL